MFKRRESAREIAEPSCVDGGARLDPLTRILGVESLGRRERAGTSALVALFSHLGLSLLAAGLAASTSRSVGSEMPPLLVSLDEGSEGPAGSGEGPAGPTPGGSGSDARPALPAVSRPAAGIPRRAESVMSARAGAPKGSRDLLDDPLARWILGLPDDAWTGTNGRGTTRSEGSGPTGAGSGGGANGGDAGGRGSGGRGGSGGSGQGGGHGASFSSDWDCSFPAWAKVGGLVRMVVTVEPDGAPASVEILSDTGRVFADVARECAMRQRYTPARDARGHPVAGKTGAFNVRFIH